VFYKTEWPFQVTGWNQMSGNRADLYLEAKMEADPPKIRTLRAHTGYVTDVAVTSDGRRALSGWWDGTIGFGP
jgi:WD40 repeat protein